MNDHTPIIEPIDLSNLRYYSSMEEVEKDYGKEEVDWKEIYKALIETDVKTNLEEIISKMIDGDILVYFISPEWTWDCLTGRAGYAIKRGEEFIDPVGVLMS